MSPGSRGDIVDGVPEAAPRPDSTGRFPTLLTIPTYVLAKLGRLAHRLTHESVADQGLLLPHFSVLTTLDDFGPLAQHELADRLGLNRSHLVRYVDVLEGRDAVHRDRDPDDRRRQVVSLTPTGQTLLTQLRTPVDEVQERFLTALSKQERATLMELLVRLLEHTGEAADESWSSTSE
jgi:DNA-binding MarR family transcriptional regulator